MSKCDKGFHSAQGGAGLVGGDLSAINEATDALFVPVGEAGYSPAGDDGVAKQLLRRKRRQTTLQLATPADLPVSFLLCHD